MKRYYFSCARSPEQREHAISTDGDALAVYFFFFFVDSRVCESGFSYMILINIYDNNNMP